MAEKDKFDEFLEEVENDIRQERFMKLWQTYGKHVTSGITGILIVLVIYTLWSNYQHKEHTKNSEFFMTAQQLLQEGNTSQALSVLKSMGNDSTYTPLAKFTEAAILSEGPEKKLDQAIAIYDQLAKDTKIEAIWRNVAALQSIRLKFELEPNKGAELLTVLEPLTADNSSLQALALEQKGYMLHTMGKNLEAQEAFVKIIQLKDAPGGVAMRAQIMSERLASGA